MFKYAIYFLSVVVSWDLWRIYAAEQNEPQNQSVLDQIAVNQQSWFTYDLQSRNKTQEKIVLLGRRIETRLLALQMEMEAQLRSLRNIVETQIEQKKNSEKINKEVFQKKGTRHFYIEKENKLSWYSAADKCRQLGGHLATIRNEREIDRVFSGVQPGSYWVDIYSLGGDEGPYVSSLSGKEVKYLKWGIDLSKYNSNHCVNVRVYGREMYTANCTEKLFFVCQAK